MYLRLIFSAEYDEEEDDEEVLAPTPKLCSELVLKMSLESGLYPQFIGTEGPAENHDTDSNSALDYLLQLWPELLTSLIATETNRYAKQKNHPKWVARCDNGGNLDFLRHSYPDGYSYASQN